MGVRVTLREIAVLAVVVVVGTVVAVAGVILYSDIGPFRWMPSTRWWGLAGTTAILLWLAAKQYHPRRRRLLFWLTLVGLLAMHILAWSVVILRTEGFGLLWFAVAAPVEGALIAWTLEKAGFGSAAA